jgi:hypothetical protein
MERYEDPGDEANSAIFHSGGPCIERGCERPAGTAWSPFWCQPCNAARMRRIGASMRTETERFDAANPAVPGEQEGAAR